MSFIRLRSLCCLIPFVLLAITNHTPYATQDNNQLTIHYEWRPDIETRNGAIVSIMISNHHDTMLTFSMPAWSPGAYRFAEYGRNVREVEAASKDGQALRVVKLDTDTWQVYSNGNPTLTFAYRVEKTPDFFGSRRDDTTHVQLEGPSTFMYLEDYRSEERRVGKECR